MGWLLLEIFWLAAISSRHIIGIVARLAGTATAVAIAAILSRRRFPVSRFELV
jgi:hypothetical protein